MNKNDALEVGRKVIGIYAFMQGISYLSVPISIHRNEVTFRTIQGSVGASEGTYPVIAFLPSALLFLLGGILWLSAKKQKEPPRMQQVPIALV